MKIYTVGSISGLTKEQVEEYFTGTKRFLESLGYTVFNPMSGKGQLRVDKIYRAKDYRHPVATNRAIIGRDRWMVGQADIIYANFANSQMASIGSMFELAWGYELRKHIIAVVPKENIHQHAFVLQACDIIFETEAEAIEYLKDLIKSIEGCSNENEIEHLARTY